MFDSVCLNICCLLVLSKNKYTCSFSFDFFSRIVCWRCKPCEFLWFAWTKDKNPSFRGLDQNRYGDLGTFLKIFSDRVESGDSFRVGPGRGIFSGVWDIFPGISGINLRLNETHASHSQTEQVEWLLSLNSTLYDAGYHVPLQGVFTCFNIVVWKLLILS